CDECTQLLFSEIDNLTIAVKETFDLFKDGISPPWKTLTDLMKKHDLLSDKFQKKIKDAEYLLKNSDIDQCEAKVDEMKDRLKKENEIADKNMRDSKWLQKSSKTLLKDLDRLGKKLKKIIEALESFGAKNINLKDALQRSREILEQLKELTEKFNENEDQETFNYCSNITERVNSIYKPSGKIPSELLEDLKNKLNDIIKITESVEDICEKKIERIKHGDKELEMNIKDIFSKINATNDLLHQLEIVYEDLKNISNLEESRELENRIKRQMEKTDEIDELYLKALDHAQKLQNKIEKYESMFNFSKDEWKKINASGAYEAIINGIKEAKLNVDLARQVLENATKIIAPEDSDHIIDKANLAHAFSDRLKQRINNLKKYIKNILENGKANNDLNQILHVMELDITFQSDRVFKLEEVIANSTNLSDEMQQLEKKINDMQLTSQSDFFKKYQLYLNFTSKEEITKLKSKLNNTREMLQGLHINSTYYDTVQSFNNENANKNLKAIQDKIDGLRNRIYYAKQAADTINVAMNLSNCAMSYKLPQAEIFQSLSVTFKCKNCNLFEWSNKNGQSLSLKIENFKPLLVVEGKRILIDSIDDKERTVNIQKLGSLIKMQLDTIEKSQRVGSYYYIIDIDDDIKIGNFDKQLFKDDAYIYKVTLNEKNFGLDTVDRQTDNINTYFSGNGYRIYGRNNKLNPSKLTLGFDFSTFDENSLLYLAQEECAYIALYLENGYLKFNVRHTNNVTATLMLDGKFNNGKQYQAEITMEYDTTNQLQHYILFGKNDTYQDRKRASKTLTKRNVFKIKHAVHYIGGVPPTFNRTCIDVSKSSFLGFLDLNSQLTNESISYGIITTNKKNLDFYKAWINQNGYMKIKLTKEHFNTISYMLRPIQPNGLIFNLTQYVIYLNNYKLLIVGLNSNYTSEVTLNKNEYSIIQMSVKHEKLTINDKEYNVKFPDKINIQDFIIQLGASGMGYSGGISNILINNKELLLNSTTVEEFLKVEIGREPPLSTTNDAKLKSLPSNLSNSMQNTESCASVANYVTDPDAVKFGDRPNSYTLIRTKFWKTDYKIAFKFRTFYPNGVIFISIGLHKQQHYNFLELREGKLNLHTKGRKKECADCI
ncbi:hypothetical protein NQ317_007978, partial [Molorchus minor]